MDKITAQIKEQWLREIIAKRKRIEYREIKPFWNKRLSTVQVPFRLRLINGMRKKAPEATAVVTRVIKNTKAGEYELHLGRILETKNWNRKLENSKGR